MAFMVDRNENGINALGDDRYTWSLYVYLLPFSYSDSYILERGVLDFVSFCEAFCFIFVAENVIGILKHSVDLICVELD